MGNKTITIYDYILDKNVDVMIITESWLGDDDPVIIGECTPLGYSFLNFNRSGDKHGGIAIISKSSLNLSVSPIKTVKTTFEHACVTFKTLRLLIIIYRPLLQE